MLLEILNVEVIKINCVPDGNFAHDPEPLDKNLNELKKVLVHNADLGIAVDLMLIDWCLFQKVKHLEKKTH